ncbi:galactosylceramidase [Actinoplanes sp. SE50]|uniref:ricin-type beta-trefoil lectin domain protein n=1 Tax=unclassified Actinoplanes TaxID=2626549 RepID=UPI00006CA2DD|nr:MULTISPECIES: ricin-type beta-trefoil lectin domain protein [unclassified Actinoplanes]AEV84583.1 galactosylceramidase [Actinoplanes sp. SE50/110]ATO82975.1 galactosylceramidase [Actinoplanes sp. SE50]CAJ81035.1 putative galactocerebrosidase [Actinoplanes sp. SE50/110]SLM00383.1 galactosylceramidase [Actinoplanes sp. SE50/110]
MRHLLMVAVTAAAIGTLAAPAPAAAATTVALNGGIVGRAFDGVGAISGGGGNSRLLIDYPEPQRGQILDYLFKPGYGAAVQLLKLEIGGDANSTDGSEPSHQHVRGDINCNAGYEFWLGEQAVARNPGIRLVALPWAAPGWIGGGSFWSTDMINYDVSWLNCARQYGLTISYLGGWNERGHDSTWYKNLRTGLDNAGYSAVQIVGDDSGWGMADEFAADPTLKNAVGVLGNHYVCGYLSQADSCSTTGNARSSGKPLWASEFGSQDDNAGVVPYIRTVNRGYLDAEISGYMNWPLIAAITPNLPFATVGLMDAGSPWSGAYRVGRNLWANAHYAQFTQPGWHYLNSSASGYLGGNRANGSYVTLKSTNNTDYSTIYETSGSTAAQTVNVTVSGGLSTGTVHVWSTDMGSSNSADWFVRQADITPVGATYTLNLQPNRIYTVTTTTGQGKGTAAGPAPHGLALPYSDNFDGYAVRKLPHYSEDMQGSFETRACSAGRGGTCLQQVAPLRPINWQDDSDAFTLFGDTGWTNYTVSLDVNMQQAGTVTLLGRANIQNRPQNRQAAYQLRVTDNGGWSIVKHTNADTDTTLVSGTRAALGLNSWHNLRLGFSGGQITAAIDNTTVGTVTDYAYGAGQAGVGVVGYQTDQFDNLSVTPNSGPALNTLRGVESGRCADVPGASQTNGTQLALWDCNGGSNQNFTLTDQKQLLVYGSKCLDVNAGGTADGAKVQIWDCHGGTNQQWTLNADGTIVGIGSGKCLDATGHGTANGTLLEIWTCNGGDNQKWSRS